MVVLFVMPFFNATYYILRNILYSMLHIIFDITCIVYVAYYILMWKSYITFILTHCPFSNILVKYLKTDVGWICVFNYQENVTVYE